MKYDYSKLLGRIVEVYGNNANFAKKMGLSEHSLSCKLNNKVGFKQSEIEKAIDYLNIKQSEIGSYFFKKNVQR